MSATEILSRFDVEAFKREAEALTKKFTEVSVSSFKRHVCCDCGKPTSKFSALRCKSCNMKRVGKQRQKELREQRLKK